MFRAALCLATSSFLLVGCEKTVEKARDLNADESVQVSGDTSPAPNSLVELTKEERAGVITDARKAMLDDGTGDELVVARIWVGDKKSEIYHLRLKEMLKAVEESQAVLYGPARGPCGANNENCFP